jgi:hypothetical protein
MLEHRRCGTQDPDLAKCQTRRVGALIPGVNREMYYCSIDNAECRFAIPFGFDYLCRHERNHTFTMPESTGV